MGGLSESSLSLNWEGDFKGDVVSSFVDFAENGVSGTLDNLNLPVELIEGVAGGNKVFGFEAKSPGDWKFPLENFLLEFNGGVDGIIGSFLEFVFDEDDEERWVLSGVDGGIVSEDADFLLSFCSDVLPLALIVSICSVMRFVNEFSVIDDWTGVLLSKLRECTAW